MDAPTLDHAQLDRASTVLLAAACGDALGVPYEFQPPLRDDQRPDMIGGGLGPYAPGEYSDDTQLAVCIAQVTATGADLRDDAALDRVAGNFLRWRHHGATDIGNQTRHVLDTVGPTDATVTDGLAGRMREVARTLHQRTGRTAGNGSLMRTAPVALAHLTDPTALAGAAHAVSALTHHDPLAGEACVLWCAGIRRAVLDASLDGVRDGLDLLPAHRRDQWSTWLTEAETHPPHHFRPNGYVVTALQAAWSAVVHTDGDLVEGLHAAVRAGDDTDTVAAIAGALLGARCGLAAVPGTWRRAVHGWPGLHAPDLVRLATLTVRPDTGRSAQP
jgi:ADP-ribosylglycohydrolase